MKIKVQLLCSIATLSISNLLNGQVNLQTGAAQANIPLYSYADPANRIGTGMSLVYTAGNGLKVSEVPSCVGTGWELSSGGVITRIQNGEPDDQKRYGTFTYPAGANIANETEYGNYYDYKNGYYPNGYLYSEYDPSIAVDNGGAYTPLFAKLSQLRLNYKTNPKYLADREQDVFSFSFNGRSGEFVIGKNGNIRTLVDSKLKITKATTNMSGDNIRTDISEFDIIDETGIKYVFKELELSEVCIYDQVTYYYSNGTTETSSIYYSSPSNNPGNYQKAVTGRAIGQYVVSKWYLSEIINTLTGVKISFQYESYNIDLQTNKTVSKSSTGNTTDFLLNVGRVKTISKRLKKITSSNKENVELNYSPLIRVDINTDKSLDEIVIKYDNKVITTWKFSFGYFVKNIIKEPSSSFTAIEQKYSRLCLKSLQKTGEPPYLFTYNLGSLDINLVDIIPPIFSYYHDNWGYFNGKVWFYFYSDPDEILWNYSLAYNTLSNPSAYKQVSENKARNGVLNSIMYPAGGSLTFEYEQNKLFDPQTNIDVFTGGVRVLKTTVYDGINHAKDIVTEYKYIKANGNSSGWGKESFVYTNSRSMKVWNCGDNNHPGISAEQVASAVFTGSVTQILGVSSPHQLEWQIIFTLISLLSAPPPYYDFTVTETQSEHYAINNPLPQQYSRVEVINKLSNDNIGKTVYEYTSPDLYTFEVSVLNFPFSNKPRVAGWQYGLPTVISVSDKLNNPIKRSEYSYLQTKYYLNDLNFISQKWDYTVRTYNCDFQLITSSTSDIASENYYPLCGKLQLSQTKEYTYNTNAEYAVVTTDYEYSPNNDMPNKVKTTNSKGEVIEANTYYPQDYTLSGPIQSMKDNNILNVPVSSQTFITKNGTQKYLLNGRVSEFSTIANGDIKAARTYSFRSDNPIISTSVSFSSSQLLPNATYYKEIGSVNYDNTGLPVQVNKDEGKSSILYDYENKLPVAVVNNASSSDIAYTSFETDGNGKWTFPSTDIISDNCPTGKKCYKFPIAGTIISSLTLDNSKTYILSFWCKASFGGAPYVNKVIPIFPFYAGVEPSKTYANTITGWVYYEYEIYSTIGVSVDNYRMPNGSSVSPPRTQYSIDELRLYPKGSNITTTTYDPLIGKTSECDTNGRIAYYEYDLLGRLRFIRDENRNVAKMYEYNYKR